MFMYRVKELLQYLYRPADGVEELAVVGVLTNN